MFEIDAGGAIGERREENFDFAGLCDVRFDSQLALIFQAITKRRGGSQVVLRPTDRWFRPAVRNSSDRQCDPR